MRVHLSILMLVAAVSTTAMAQRAAPIPHFQGRPPAFHSAFGHAGRAPVLIPFPFYDPAGWDYPAAVAHPQPQVVIVQPASPSQAPEPVREPTQPLLIELRGDSYVQVSGNPGSQSQMLHLTEATTRTRRVDEHAPITPTPSSRTALLIFRDGHREEVSSYTIANGVLYAKADFYTDGSWNRSIPMSSLNLPQTIQSNQSRGVAFRVPGASNEVIVGP